MKTIELLKTKQLTTSTNAKGELDIKSTDRNALKKDLMADFQDFLAERYKDDENIDISRTADGVAMGIYNETMDTVIPLVFDITFKKLDYDIEVEADSYELEMQEKAEKKADREKKKQAKIARDRAERERKAIEKATQKALADGKISMKTINSFKD